MLSFFFTYLGIHTNKNLFKSGLDNTYSVKNDYHTGKTYSLLTFYLSCLIEGDGYIIVRKGSREKISQAINFFNERPFYDKLNQGLNFK